MHDTHRSFYFRGCLQNPSLLFEEDWTISAIQNVLNVCVLTCLLQSGVSYQNLGGHLFRLLSTRTKSMPLLSTTM